MGTKLKYKSGSFYRVCDQSGFVQRAEHTKKTWQGYLVRPQSFEPRNAQDLVKGRRDNQTVPEARPRQTNQFIGLTTTLLAPGATTVNVLIVSSPFGTVPGSKISVILADGTNFFTHVRSSAADFNTDFSTSDFNVNSSVEDFNSDFSTDFALLYPGGILIYITRPLPSPALAGALVTNFSVPPVSLANAMSSVS